MLDGLFRVKRVDFEYKFAITAAGALSLLNLYPFDAAVLDYKLPDYIGGTVAKLVRDKYPRLPLAYMTNVSDDEVVAESRLLNVTLWPTKIHLMKNLDELLKLVRELIDAAPCDDDDEGGRPDGSPGRRGGASDSGHRRRRTDKPLSFSPAMQGTIITPIAGRGVARAYAAGRRR